MSKTWLQTGLLVALTLLVYVHSPLASFIPIDDGSLTFKNPIVTEFDVRGAFSTYDPELYIPLTLFSYQIDYLIGGEDPTIFHIVNVLLHILNAVLVFFLTKVLVKKEWVPLIAGLLFALHPLHTEAVMWIAARKDLLSCSFFLGSLLLYCNFRKSGRREPYYLSIALFAFALLAKIVTATLPLVLLLIDDVIPTKKKLYPYHKYPYYILALFFAFIGIYGKTLSFYQITFFETFLLAAKSASFYMQKLLLPTNLTIFYQQITPLSHLSPLSPEFLLPLLFLTLLYIAALKGRQLDKMISFAILWYGVTLFPNLANFSRVSKESIFFASDRYAYIPSISLIILFAYGATSLKAISYKLKAVLVVAATITLGITTHLQTQVWLAPTPLFAHNIEVEPRTHMAHTMLGIIAQNEERHAEAITHFRHASDLAPTLADARAHLGLSLIKDGQFNRGIFELHEAIRNDPDYIHAYEYLAYGYLLQRELRNAEETVQRLLAREPNNAKAYYLLGLIEEARGNLDAAKGYLEHSLELNPRDIRAKSLLTKLLTEE